MSSDNPWQSAGKEIDITFKIRHTPEFTKGKLVQEGDRQFRILSSEKLQGIAPGQFGVVYDEAAQVCVGSGGLFLCNERECRFVVVTCHRLLDRVSLLCH